jgi:signal transduction histidine kinase
MRAGYVADPLPRPIGARPGLSGRRRDGSTFPAEISLSAIDTDEGILVTAAVRDITERRALEAEHDRLRTRAERDRLEGLGQLAGGIAHDFNNLLGIISNYAAFIGDEVSKESPRADRQAVRDDVQQIERAAERAAGLTRQLLAFGRREVIRPQMLNLNDVIARAEPLLTRILGEHLELDTDLAAGLSPVLADPGQIERVLGNLASNARDAMAAGGTLTIRTASTEIGAAHAASRAGMAPGRYVSLEIIDTGTGMPEDIADRAFEPFFTTKANEDRPGLGLPSVYGIIAQSRGHVQIHSEPGAGTTVAILLPAATQAAEVSQTAAAQQASQRRDARIVLVVEDEAALREAARRILARNGYQVITAASGPEAIEAAAGHRGVIDLLLTDVVMPQMLGIEAAERIRALQPSVTVLYMSGYTDGAVDDQGVLVAGVNLIPKPFTEATLLAKVREVLSPAR